jgi:UDP-N-acetylmuramate dehydrogenase
LVNFAFYLLNISKNINLKSYNTFGIEAYCAFFVEINSVEDFQELIKTDIYQQHEKLILGGGSNVLFTKDFSGLVVKNNLKGIQIVSETNEEVLVKAMAGENWHEFVMWCIDKKFHGLENLSLIPGCVGASPMQNIGAYGVEIKEVFKELEAYHLKSGEREAFDKRACNFGYRESVFKATLKNQYLITSVTFVLKKEGVLNIGYGALSDELAAAGITQPGIKDVSNVVIKIRQSKLPDPKITGNAGSFFKNPEVSKEKFDELRKSFQGLVAYALPNGNFKLAAGWLIEQCGLKGYEHQGAAVHSKQALVLINQTEASGKAIFDLSTIVMEKVRQKFGVELEREVNII